MSERAGSSETFKVRRETEDVELDITPMIDITFLLLAFFVVASKMQEQAPIALPYAKHGAAIAAKDAIMINIEQASADVEGLFYLGRTMEPGQGIEESSEDLEEQITEFVAGELAKNDKVQFVLVRAGFETRMKNISLAKKAANKAFPEDREITIHVAVNEGT